MSKIQNEFLENLKRVDLIFAPTSPTTAFKIGEKVDDPLQMYLTDVFTVSMNLAGVPSVCFPIGHDPKGLPIGAQFVGSPYREDKILGCVGAYERANPIKKGAIRC